MINKKLTLKHVKDLIDRGESVWVATAQKHSYSTSLAQGSTSVYVLTIDSKPNFSLSVKENRELGLIKEIDPILIETITLYSDDFSDKYKVIVIADRPFHLWVRHRGFTGDRSDNYDTLIEAKEIQEFHKLLKLFENKWVGINDI